MQGIFGHKILGIDHVFHAFIIVMPGVHGKKHIFIGIRILAECGYQSRLVGIADIVFPAVRHVVAVAQGGQGHVT